MEDKSFFSLAMFKIFQNAFILYLFTMRSVGFISAIGANFAYPLKYSWPLPISRSGEGGCSKAGLAGAPVGLFWLYHVSAWNQKRSSIVKLNSSGGSAKRNPLCQNNLLDKQALSSYSGITIKMFIGWGVRPC